MYNIYRKRKKNRLRFLKWSVISILIIAFIVTFKIYSDDMFGLIGNDVQRLVSVPAGASVENIAKALEYEEVIHHTWLFRLVSRISGQERYYQMGDHLFTTKMSYTQIIDELKKPAILSENDVVVTIPEGYEIYRVAELLEQKELVSKEEFLRVADEGNFKFEFVQVEDREINRLEGYIFPETYIFSKSAGTEAIITKILATFEKRFSTINNTSNMTTDEILTLASIIEREAKKEDFKRVSSVFHNRIRLGIHLQSCATVQYILEERKPVLSIADTRIESPYNTYLYEGLPIGPICSPSLAAIDAAINPEKTDYMFFIGTGDKTIFSKTYEEHQAAMKAHGI